MNLIRVQPEFIKSKMIQYLQRGDIILVVRENNVNLLNASPINHILVYNGLNTKSMLINIKNNVLNNTEEAEFLYKNDIYVKENLLNNIDKYIENTNDYDYNLMEIKIKGFNIINIESLLKLYKKIYVYRLNIKHPNAFGKLYLYFVGNNYNIFSSKGEYCCFSSVFKLLLTMYSYYPNIYLKIIKYFDIYRYHYTSRSITDNKENKKVLMYYHGVLKIF